MGMVEHWLSSVSRRGIVPPETMTGQHHGQHHPNVLGWRPHGLLAQGVPQQRYKRTRSRDSSIIIDSAKKAGWSPSTAIGHRPKNTTKPNDTFVLADTLPTKFDKRSRHRTREDRYDTQKHARQKRKKSRDERPAPSKVPSKEMGFSRREVMDDFRSDAILNDRLTVSKNGHTCNLLLTSSVATLPHTRAFPEWPHIITEAWCVGLSKPNWTIHLPAFC